MSNREQTERVMAAASRVARESLEHSLAAHPALDGASVDITVTLPGKFPERLPVTIEFDSVSYAGVTAPTCAIGTVKPGRDIEVGQLVTDADLEPMPRHRCGCPAADGPECDGCGHVSVRNGSSYKCLNCGNAMAPPASATDVALALRSLRIDRERSYIDASSRKLKVIEGTAAELTTLALLLWGWTVEGLEDPRAEDPWQAWPDPEGDAAKARAEREADRSAAFRRSRGWK